MTRGYLCIVQDNGKVDYLEQAYALALNLKLTQQGVSNLCVAVDEKTKKLIKEKHKRVFDKIVDIPWGDHAAESEWKIQNKWKVFYMTPYDETVLLDADMLFPSDVSYWWDSLKNHDVWAATTVRDFRGNPIEKSYYRRAFWRNDLPNVYTAFLYFKKTEFAAELFAMAEIIYQHWERFYFINIKKDKPEHVSGDVVFALAMKILGIENECTKPHITSMPTFTHMKGRDQDIVNAPLGDNWMLSLPTYYKSSNNFKIGNFKQVYPFHYVEPDWLTKDRVKQLEKEYYV